MSVTSDKLVSFPPLSLRFNLKTKKNGEEFQ